MKQQISSDFMAESFAHFDGITDASSHETSITTGDRSNRSIKVNKEYAIFKKTSRQKAVTRTTTLDTVQASLPNHLIRGVSDGGRGGRDPSTFENGGARPPPPRNLDILVYFFLKLFF